TGVLVVTALVLTAFTSSSASEGAALAYQSANKAYVELCRDSSARKSRTNWLQVINEFSVVFRNHPKSRYAPSARYRTAGLYEQLYGYSGRKGDLEDAASVYLDLVKRYPQSTLADDALYKTAGIYTRLGREDKAVALYRKIVSQYPGGDMVASARKELKSVQVQEQPIKGSSSHATVKKVRQWSNKDYNRVVIDLEKEIPFSTMTLGPDKNAGRPDRLVIDLDNARTLPGAQYKTSVNEGILSDIRLSQFNRDKVRVVLDLTGKPYYETFILQDPPRLVIDVSSNRKSIKDVASYQSNIKKVRSGTPTIMPTDMPSIASQFSLKVSRIVIDPGHGGKDPGALGPGGIKEKDITLAIGKLLAKRLKQEGFEVYLTRQTDVFLTLEERTTFANRKKADLFISIHVNSNVDTSVRGIETYFLNLTTDASAIEVAARENATSSKSISDLQLIINDLMLNSKINESSKFADSVHKYVMSSAKNVGYRGRDLGVRQAPFYVLLGAQMPSILVELGFITNSTDLSLLRKETYQKTMVDGIAKGINNYIMNTTYAYRGRTR
ncbi:MAG TPA: N-acetylmuramoyl-L-alanine amidase, partial [Deltaproteobacteria bacterium]|nr:N-acetylmuramoyl-L-alanine amidase [Deltaproteobacteria bacterium]